MAIVRWEPFREMVDWQRSLERLWGEPFARGFFRDQAGGAPMPLDVYYQDDALVLKGSLPGMKPEDIDISVTGDMLTIKGETKTEETVKAEDYVCREMRRGTFGRTITLPKDVDAAKIEAAYEGGVLTLTVPKGEAHKPKQIKVKAGETVTARKASKKAK